MGFNSVDGMWSRGSFSPREKVAENRMREKTWRHEDFDNGYRLLVICYLRYLHFLMIVSSRFLPFHPAFGNTLPEGEGYFPPRTADPSDVVGSITAMTSEI